VQLQECKIIGMHLNAVSGSDNATIEVDRCSISGSGMAAIYLEGACKVSLKASHLFDNLCCISVWAGYGEERWVKVVGTDPSKHEDEVKSNPKSSLYASGNKLHGTIWAGLARPLHFEEHDNEILDETVYAHDDDSDDVVPFYEDSGEFDNKTAAQLWDIYGPVSIPKWAPKDRLGGDGVVQWGPAQGIVDRDPIVLTDVRLGDELLRSDVTAQMQADGVSAGQQEPTTADSNEEAREKARAKAREQARQDAAAASVQDRGRYEWG